MPEKKKSAKKALFHSKQTSRHHTKHLLAITVAEGRGYAVIISKKTLSRSVDRHRLKRRIQNILSTTPSANVPKTLIIFPKATALHLSSENLEAEIKTLLSEVKFSGKIE